MTQARISRRRFLASGAAAVATLTLPGLAFGRSDAPRRLVVIVLRGGADGLAIAAPYAEPRYAALRGPLALAAPGTDEGLLDIDGTFGLHPALPEFHRMVFKGQALVVHAVASPYRDRSHFDAQAVLENGIDVPGGSADGWLNRALVARGGEMPTGVAVAPTPPLIARGEAPFDTWSDTPLPGLDDDTLDRIVGLYADTPGIQERLMGALASRERAGGMSAGRGGAALVQSARIAGRLLAPADGPAVAVLEAGGWDTHAGQGAARGRLAGRLGQLDRALATLERELGPAWERTAVLAVSEFGRTVRANGTGGTDHGTAGVAMLAGGAVAGGRVVADWPGLRSADLHEGRDLRPTMDLRSVLKGVLGDHLGVPGDALETAVFPDSRRDEPLDGLIRT